MTDRNRPTLLSSLLLAGAALLCSVPAQALESFVADYHVLNGGKTLGAATMQVVKNDPQRWRVDLGMRGTGLFRIAGINAEQSTVFDTVGETYRPLSQGTVRKTLFTRKSTTGTYDWQLRKARWKGDVKKTRTAAVPLRDGDMSGLLINLAVIRDAQPGKALHYRFVDDGRVRDHHYTVAEQLEPMTVGDMNYNAMRVTRVQAGNEETVIWVVDGVPTPIRMLQRENGQDTYDLRLVEYKGIQ
ncbi:DUF3108 domain-containing protein [Lysobacter koreensis]|uniref:DUF3108 domain-containing protein n=1 Tax=Lysobacter koreensis TaxID=266122 RepID=A0ABW2YMX6_9GAMM